MNVSKAAEAMTDRIAAYLEAGNLPPWAKELKSGGINGPVRNAFTNRAYNGWNIFILNMRMLDQGYSDPRFATKKQIEEKGGKIIAGQEKAFEYINFWDFLTQKDKYGRVVKDANGKEKKFPMLKVFRVYNVEQTEGLKLESFIDDSTEPFVPIEECARVWDAWQTKPPVKHGGDQAAYYPHLDVIKMPPAESFSAPEHYYSTLFHEGGHATGHGDRLKRPGIADPSKFGSTTYAREELVAEMFAAIMCNLCGIETKTIENHAAYCKSWAAKLREDANLLIVAAGAAAKAVDYVLANSEVLEPELV